EGLAARAKTGARADLEELLAASLPVTHALARARLGDGAAALEAATDALARVARGLPKLSDPAKYPHWLRKIVARCASDARRSIPRAVEDRMAPRVDPGPGPVETLLARERGRVVRAAIAGLPPKLREVVFLHYLEELPYREIARVIGKGLGTVARRMERAQEVLRRALKESA
ncbi:MAG: RNA polymerase sigma factor, partial [Planctomycetota bacterium]|nr:RNA polymerase sigma factor [Planctomycetota bacterium]